MRILGVKSNVNGGGSGIGSAMVPIDRSTVVSSMDVLCGQGRCFYSNCLSPMFIGIFGNGRVMEVGILEESLVTFTFWHHNR